MVTNILTTLTLDTWTAFGHGLLFAAALAIVTRIALVLVPPATAATRFAVWFATLLTIAVIPPAFMIQTAAPALIEHIAAGQQPPVTPARSFSDARQTTSVAVPPGLAPSASPLPRVAPPARTTEAKTPSWQTSVPLSMDDAAGFLAVYIAIVVLLFVRLGVSYLRLCRLKKKAYPVPPEVARRFENWLALCKTYRPVRIVLSSSARSPMAVGFAAPVVIVPDSLLLRLTGEELDHIGLHELAHIRRYDDWTNLIQKAIQAIFFFNPLVHWIARKIDFEREVACDDWVLTATGQAKPYARSLTKVLECAPWRSGPILASGAVFRKRQIFRRIEMLLDGSRDSRPRISHVTLVVVLMCLFGAFTQIVQLPAVVAFNEGLGGSYQRSNWRVEGRNIETEIRGNVEFADDDISVRSMSPGSYVRVQETAGSTRKKLEIREGHPDPVVTYSVNGRPRTLDEGRAWIGTILPSVIRELGIGAEERVARILQKRGPAGVFDEIDRISSDHVRRRYLSSVIGSGRLNPDDLQRAMARVARLSSDHEKANLLVEVVDTYDSETLRNSYFEAVNTINSDHERRRVLVKVIEESNGEPAVLARAGRSVERMQSDHEKSQVLQISAKHVRLADADVRRSLARAAESINSDHDKAQVVKSVFESGELAPEILIDFLKVAGTIQSDHEKAQVLQLALHQDMKDASVQKAFFAAAGTINSDHDRAQVLKAAIERGQMKTALSDQIASSAQRISSDHDKANVLEKLAGDNASAAVAAAVGSINSDTDKRRVLQAMVENSRSVETAKSAVSIAATLSSDNDKAQVLAMLAEKYGSDRDINEAIRRAADRIGSDSDYRRIVSKLLADRKEQK
jgi:beta-lactamase regulating signal transducer with metallopeptidase domain